MMEKTILHALAQLDVTNPQHWTQDGLPRVDVVSQLAGSPVTRDDINAVVEGLTIDTWSEFFEEDDNDDKQDNSDEQDELKQAQQEVEKAQQKLNEARASRDKACAEFVVATTELDRANAKLHALTKQESRPEESVMAFLQAQNVQRRNTARQAKQLQSLGLKDAAVQQLVDAVNGFVKK